MQDSVASTKRKICPQRSDALRDGMSPCVQGGVQLKEFAKVII